MIMPVSVPPDQPFQLMPLFRERVWGRHTLAPYFRKTDRTKRIGEAWFTFEENQTALGGTLGELITAHPEILGNAAEPGRHPGACPLLVKLLFTTERLSVQVHPGDEYARTHHASAGKTEAWYVLDAEPDHRIEFPSPSIWPLLTALATTGLFIGSIFTPWAVVYGAVPVFATMVGWFWPKSKDEGGTQPWPIRHRTLPRPNEAPSTGGAI